ncbi:MAG: hypothetical protein ACI9LE_000322 [Paraglaciecola sp.]|jgi:hypothetical protein
MGSVDLNPIHAKTEKTPETSAHTSINTRTVAVKEQTAPAQVTDALCGWSQAKHA